ncbi:MAG: CBS domain-containing protein [Chlorobiaceae bacterium]|nr:CBS domain-containing protein [Chlorobiaceae bacterium]NTW75024.1 CBS domain-containing protein [Chlorobiaceae bacterium]
MGVIFTSMIEADYPVFGLDDLAGEAARRLADCGLASAPVLDGPLYVGMVTLSGLLAGRKGFPQAKSTLRSVRLEPVPGFAQDAQLFESLRAVATVGSEVIPLLDSDMRYVGVVTRRAILGVLAERFHVEEGVSTLEIEVPPPGAKLSEMIAAIEKNDASVVSYSSKPSGMAGGGVVLFFRVMTHDFFRLVRNLENYGYLVDYHSPFPDVSYDEMREKALEFIRYMDM